MGVKISKSEVTVTQPDHGKEILVRPETSMMLAEASFQPTEQKEDEEGRTQDRVIEVSRTDESNSETTNPEHSKTDDDPESDQEAAREVP
jgi:hypothetical protein